LSPLRSRPPVRSRSDHRDVVQGLFADLESGADPASVAERFSETIDRYIPGDMSSVPWIGRKHGRAGVAEFFTQLPGLVVSEKFKIAVSETAR